MTQAKIEEQEKAGTFHKIWNLTANQKTTKGRKNKMKWRFLVSLLLLCLFASGAQALTDADFVWEEIVFDYTRNGEPIPADKVAIFYGQLDSGSSQNIVYHSNDFSTIGKSTAYLLDKNIYRQALTNTNSITHIKQRLAPAIIAEETIQLVSDPPNTAPRLRFRTLGELNIPSGFNFEVTQACWQDIGMHQGWQKNYSPGETVPASCVGYLGGDLINGNNNTSPGQTNNNSDDGGGGCNTGHLSWLNALACLWLWRRRGH